MNYGIKSENCRRNHSNFHKYKRRAPAFVIRDRYHHLLVACRCLVGGGRYELRNTLLFRWSRARGINIALCNLCRPDWHRRRGPETACFCWCAMSPFLNLILLILFIYSLLSFILFFSKLPFSISFMTYSACNLCVSMCGRSYLDCSFPCLVK